MTANLHYLYVILNLLITLLLDIAWYMPIWHKQKYFWMFNFFFSNDVKAILSNYVEPKIYIEIPYSNV